MATLATTSRGAVPAPSALGDLGTTMFDRLGTITSRYWVAIILGWLLLAAGLRGVAPRWDDVTHDGDLAYLPAGMPSVEGERLLRLAFPDNEAKSELAIVVERPGSPLKSADLLWSDGLAERFRARQADLPIVDVWNRNTDITGDKLISRISQHGQAAVTLLHLRNEFMAIDNMRLLDEVQTELAAARQEAPKGLNVGLTGSAAVGGDMLRSATESIRNTELATVVLVVLILLVVYRAPLLVLIPLATIGVSLVVSTSLLALLTQVHLLDGFAWWDFKVFTTTKIFIVVILFGAGTDFCLFLIARYKEELEAGVTLPEAVAAAVGRVGEALLGSALTTICGLGMMFFADFGKYRNSGPAIALCLAVALLACLTLAPALLRASGRVVFWPWGLPAVGGRKASDAVPEPTLGNRFWDWAAAAVVRRPGTILVVSLLLLSPLAYAGTSLEVTYDLLHELEHDRPSVRGAEMARRYFQPGEMAPVTVLAFKPEAHFDQPTGEREIARLTKRLYDLEGMTSVRSMSEPMGDPPGYFQPFRRTGLKKIAARRHKDTKAIYLTQAPGLVGDVTRFDLLLDQDPFSLAAIQQLDAVDDYFQTLRNDPESPWHQASFAFVGTAVGIRDLRAVTASDRRLIQQLVVISVLAVLIVLLRRPVICCYLIASVLFSYYVTIGSSQLFFTWLYGETYFGLDWKVPIFLFVILIAVGQDYNIYLVTRVFEEQERYGAIEGLRRAVARTGGIITSCGVIMAGTFLSMTTGTLRGMLELGFALSLGVMLDTCVVRPILVPAFLALVARLRPQAAAPAAQLSAGNGQRPVGLASHTVNWPSGCANSAETRG